MLEASFCEYNLKILLLFSALFKIFFLHSSTAQFEFIKIQMYGPIIFSLLFEIKQES